MISLLQLVGEYGWQSVLIAIGVYVLLRGEIHFRYPRE